MNDIQRCILGIFRQVEAIAERHGVPYFAIGGTAIGAARHGGFIPWDDDLDIAIPIEHYERFLELAEAELPPGFGVVRYGPERPHYWLPFAKIEDLRTTDIEPFWYGSQPDCYGGVWVDIMPLSGVPAGRVGQLLMGAGLRLLTMLDARMRYPLSQFRRARLLWILMYPLRRLAPRDLFMDMRFRLLERCPVEGSKCVGYTWLRDLRRNIIFPSSWYADFVRLPFEDTTIRMSASYDQVLSWRFGDYMTPPPESERVTHEGFIDLEHPFSDYVSGRLSLPPSPHSS